MCNLCNEILNEEQLEKWFDTWHEEDNKYEVICKTNENIYNLYSAVEDYYYTPQTRMTINYCPICGRKINV